MGAMFCGACGFPASSEDRFCRRCGRELSEPPVPAVPSPAADVPTPRLVTAPAPARRRDPIAIALRLVSVAGLVLSGYGLWATAFASRGSDLASADAVSAVAGAPTAGHDAGEVESAPPTTATCTSSLGYRLTYPVALVTLDSPADAACRFFDDRAFPAPSGRDLPSTQIRIYAANESYRSLDRGLSNTDGLRRSNVRVDGRRGFVVEMRDVQTDDGDRGTLYAYVIDLDGEALVADAFEPFSDRFRATVRTLDEMMGSLR
jgi:hypothetical protein